MPRQKDVLFYILFQGRKIPITGQEQIETINKFISLVGDAEKPVERKKTAGKKIDPATRKKKVKEMMGKGMKKAEIARQLNVTYQTVLRDLKEGKKE